LQDTRKGSHIFYPIKTDEIRTMDMGQQYPLVMLSI